MDIKWSNANPNLVLSHLLIQAAKPRSFESCISSLPSSCTETFPKIFLAVPMNDQKPTMSNDVFETEAIATALEEVAHPGAEPTAFKRIAPSSTKPKLKATATLKAEQEMRKFRGTDTPDPTLGIDMNEFTSFTQHLRSSKRILALIGAGLSVGSGLVTFRGDDTRWRGIEPQDLSNIEALE